MTSVRLLCLPVLVLALAACGEDAGGPEAADAQVAGVTPAGVDPPTGAYEDPSTPVVSPPQPAPVVPANNFARFDGYGDMRFGMTPAQARESWGGQLVGDVTGDACGWLVPQWAANPGEFGFMFEGGRLVRYDAGVARVPAPDGGRVGMSRDAIESLYPGRVEIRPHPGVPGAHLLRVVHPEARTALVFETDAAGQVTRWRVGVAPQVDDTEGCR